jgi:hypothetical protein
MTKRDDIFAALLTALAPAFPAMTRNEPLQLEPSATGLANLDDGDPPELVEQFLNPVIYEFTARPVLTLAVNGKDGPTRDAALLAMVGAADTALKAITDLGGLITAIRPQPAQYSPKEIWATTGIKGAEITIELDFWSDDSLG